MIRVIGILVIMIFLYYAFKIIGRMVLNNLAKKANINPPNKESQKPKHNLDKSKAIDAQFEELK